MGLNNSTASLPKNTNGSYKQRKKVSPRVQSSPDPKSSNTHSHLKDGLRRREVCLDRKHMTKAATVFPILEIKYMRKAATVSLILEIKDIDIKKKLNFDEGLPNKTYSLLSSGCKSPPLPKFDDSQDLQELDGCNISVQDHFSSLLSLSETSGGLPMFDGSRVSPVHEASWVLNRPCDDIGQKHFQKKGNTWLHNMDFEFDVKKSIQRNVNSNRFGFELFFSPINKGASYGEDHFSSLKSSAIQRTESIFVENRISGGRGRGLWEITEKKQLYYGKLGAEKVLVEGSSFFR